jgi:hypothetical protein
MPGGAAAAEPAPAKARNAAVPLESQPDSIARLNDDLTLYAIKRIDFKDAQSLDLTCRRFCKLVGRAAGWQA